MSRKFPFITVLLLILAIAALAYVILNKREETSTPEPVDIATPTPAPSIQPIERSPTPVASPELDSANAAFTTPTPTPIPLSDSDAALQARVAELENGRMFVDLMTDSEVVRKTVRAVYGLSEGRIVRQYRPIRSPEGEFLVKKLDRVSEGDTPQTLYRIERENTARYAPYIATVGLLNNESGYALYRFLRPTFEQAYQELGIGSGNFHRALIKAIDVLLIAPDAKQALVLTRPSVQYKFEDPALESLPAAHKLMLRMGTENSEALKLELKKIRAALVEIPE